MRESQEPAEHAQAGRARAAVLSFGTVFRASILLTSLALAACQTDGSGMASSGGGLAFVSIDGPPKPTFDKLVAELSSEAQARQVKVAARDEANAYRVKGYLAMHVERGKASVAYAWDVYDQNKTRVARITGEESAGPVKGSTGWAACNDAVLAKIADRSMAELAETLGVTGTAPAGTQAAPAPTAIATASDTPRTATPAAAEAPAARAPAATQETPAQAPAETPEQPGSSGAPVAEVTTPTRALAYAAN
ncbi:hypothetical protein [Xanthobacter sediminis]|uniref:hypothetical protein n=1 Tax=Xanthobacter sediminis TaxID=3119926 RepID=UPI00372A4128